MLSTESKHTHEVGYFCTALYRGSYIPCCGTLSTADAADVLTCTETKPPQDGLAEGIAKSPSILLT